MKEIYGEMTNMLKTTAKNLGAKNETVKNLENRMKTFIKIDTIKRMLLFRRYSPRKIIELAMEYKKEEKLLVIDLSFEETLEMKRFIVGNIIEVGCKWIYEKNFSSSNEKNLSQYQ